MFKSLILTLFFLLIGCDVSNKGVLNSFNIPVLGSGKVLIDKSFSGMRQLTIQVEKEFPIDDLSSMYQGLLVKQGFVYCESENADWDTFLDGTVQPKLRVFRKVNYYMNFESKVLSIVMVSYDSENIQLTIRPDNKKQIITILLYEIKSTQSEISRLNISCLN